MTTMKLYNNGAEITFTQNQNGGNVTVTGDGLSGVSLTVEEANHLWNGKRSLGWTSEKPTFAPKEPKVKKTREEALTEKYGDKETRKAYVMAKNHFTRVVVDSLVKWQKEHRRLTVKEYNAQKTLGVKQMLKAWEECGRPSLA
jgi:hypothetical protein